MKLYVVFPIPIDIETDMLADEALCASVPVGTTPEAFVEASMLWLANAGFVTFEAGQLGAGMIESVGLTARGFLALSADATPGAGPIGRALPAEAGVKERRSLVLASIAAAV